MRRRDFVKLIGGVAASWPLAVPAQPRVVPVVGFLGPGLDARQHWLAAFRAGLANDSLGSRYRRFFGLRSLLAVSSVASGRIEFVSQRLFAPQFYGLSVHFQLLSTSCRHDAVTFSFTGGKLRRGGTLTLCARSLSSALAVVALRQPARVQRALR